MAHHETHCCPPENACGTAHSSFSPSSSNSLSADFWHSIKTKLPCQGKQNETEMKKMAAIRSQKAISSLALGGNTHSYNFSTHKVRIPQALRNFPQVFPGARRSFSIGEQEPVPTAPFRAQSYCCLLGK
jgi:hypothetical protein